MDFGSKLKEQSFPWLLIATLSILGNCSPRNEPPESRPNLLLVTIDTLRADRCSAYGYRLPTTPQMDALAREGMRFESAYAPMPVTGPTHATVLTSLQPLSHGVISNGRRLTERVTTLAEMLSQHEYRTAAIVSSYPLKQRFGFGQGFSTFDEEFPVSSASIPLPQWEGQPLDEPYDRRADETTRRAIGWIEQAVQDPSPFFLWVHYFDPHSPYDPPEPYRSQFLPEVSDPGEMEEANAFYDGEVAFTDHELGRLLDAVDLRGFSENTLVVLTADHGEGLTQHGEMEHGRLIYEEAVRVPLIFRWRGQVPADVVWPGPVELLDIVPTILDLLEISRQGQPTQGRSLAPIMRGRAVVDAEREIFVQSEYHAGGANRSAVRRGRWKYIVRHEGRGEASVELFDLETDPQELASVAEEHPDIEDQLAGVLSEWRRSQPPPSDEPSLTEKELEALKALGYVK
jgi:arylsulfatase A-like enzyme